MSGSAAVKGSQQRSCQTVCSKLWTQAAQRAVMFTLQNSNEVVNVVAIDGTNVVQAQFLKQGGA